jgi:ApbE family
VADRDRGPPRHQPGSRNRGGARRRRRDIGRRPPGPDIVDARTGLPPAGVASVTVVAGSLSRADIEATAAYAQGPAAAEWLEHRVGRTGMVVWADGSSTTVGAAP